MGELQIKSILAGLFFAVWPILMNRSGLKGDLASLIFVISSMLPVLPFALYSLRGAPLPNYWYVGVIGGISAGVGVLLLNSVLPKAMPQNVGALATLMLITQIFVFATYTVYMDGGITFRKGLGFLGAVIVAILLG